MDDQPLQDQSAERAVIGAILINASALLDVGVVLSPLDFHDEAHQWIYQAMTDLQTEQASLDYLTIADKLHQTGRLAAIGGSAYLTELISETPTSMHAARYAQIVYRLATLRRLMGASAQIAKLAYTSGNEKIDQVFTRARGLLDAATPMQSDDAVLLWLDSLDGFYNGQLERCSELDAIEAGTAPARVSFPWKAVSRFIRYLRPGMLATIAAESSVGKTVAMECCAEFWARQGLRVVFFHLELSHRFMLDRRMARHSGERLEVIESGQVTDAMKNADLAMREWSGAIHYVHCPGWSASQVVQKARQLRGRGQCDVMIVDYLQKLRLGYRSGQNKADALGNAIEGTKNGLEQMGIPGLIGSQFNRQARGQGRKTGGLIRGSGEVEEKSNVVLTLDREILDNDMHGPAGNVIAKVGERSPVVKVRVDKNTAGPTGDCELVMNGARFMMLDKQEGEEQ